MITFNKTFKISFFLILIILPSFALSSIMARDTSKNRVAYNFQSLSGVKRISTNNSNIINYKQSQVLSLRDSVGVSSLLAQGFNGTGIKIGIVDTGVYANHSQFGNRISNQKSFVSPLYGYTGYDPTTIDTIGHGTMVAGLAIGTTTGMAPAAKLVSAKIYSNGITGNAGYAGEETSSAVAAAIEWLVSQNVSIISLSIGQYNNVMREGRAWVIDKFTTENGIIFTVAAGNEGIAGINTGSLDNPGESLQAITVGMSSGTTAIDTRTSYGPRFDWVMKPDLVAPGDNLYAPSYTGPNGYTFCIGTSCATPVVAGSIADILSALKAYNLTYTPGTIKAALLATAAPIVQDSSTGASYPWWMEGAGLINASKALQYILSSSRTNGTLPELLTAYPSHLPFTTINTLFQGQQLGFNVTLVSSGTINSKILLKNFSSTFFSFPTNLVIKDTILLSFWVHIPLNAKIGMYNGSLLIATDRNNLSININIKFMLLEPKTRILFDVTHAGLNNQVATINDPIYNYQDPWTEVNLWGEFSQFFFSMTKNNVSISTSREGQLANLTYLNQFDSLMLVYPGTMLKGTFTDWWNNPTYFPDSNLSSYTFPYSIQELKTISNYFYTQGKNVIIVTSYPAMENVPTINPLLNIFNLSYLPSLIDSQLQPQLSDAQNVLLSHVTSIDFIGGSLFATSGFRGILWGYNANNNNGFAFAQWHNPQYGGNLFVTASGYFLYNFGLSYSSNFIFNNLFVNNFIKFVTISSYNIDKNLSKISYIVLPIVPSYNFVSILIVFSLVNLIKKYKKRNLF